MKSDEQLLAELEQIIAGLCWMSESDYPFQALFLGGEIELTQDHLRELAGESPYAPVEVVSIDEFFHVAVSEPDWKGEGELALAKRYQALVRWLKEHLDDLKAYRVGKINLQVYVLGRSGTGNWIGISTRVVET